MSFTEKTDVNQLESAQEKKGALENAKKFNIILKRPTDPVVTSRRIVEKKLLSV